MSTSEPLSPSLSPAIPLSLVNPGELVIIQRIQGGRTVRQRLMELGMNQGARVRVMQNEHNSPMIIAVKDDGRLALGRGMAHHVLVTPFHNEGQGGQ
ncbi:MAG: ferrous iron transport protein A [Chloroflexota bacterium]